ncbi:MAG: hypothetical protein QW692_06590, partial [Nitrososphaerota archaeon]
ERVETQGSEAKVVLRVSYLDSLRNRGEVRLEGLVEVPQPAEAAREQAPQIPVNQLIPVIVIIALLIAVVYLARRSKKVETG